MHIATHRNEVKPNVGEWHVACSVITAWGVHLAGPPCRPPLLLHWELGEGSRARIEGCKTVRFASCRRFDGCLRAWRSSFDMRIICRGPACFVNSQPSKTNTCTPRAFASLSFKRNTQPGSVANGPGLDYRPTVAKNSAQRVSVAAEGAQTEWAASSR